MKIQFLIIFTCPSYKFLQTESISEEEILAEVTPVTGSNQYKSTLINYICNKLKLLNVGEFW